MIELKKMKVSELRQMCEEYNLEKTGLKAVLVERILEYQNQEKKKIESQKQNEILMRGEQKKINNKMTNIIDTEFENKTWPAYIDWWNKSKFDVFKQIDKFKWNKIDNREIRATFMDYDYTKSELRKDRLVPVPTNSTEKFLEMFFEKVGGEWSVFPKDEYDEEDIEFDESTEQDFIKCMKA